MNSAATQLRMQDSTAVRELNNMQRKAITRVLAANAQQRRHPHGMAHQHTGGVLYMHLCFNLLAAITATCMCAALTLRLCMW